VKHCTGPIKALVRLAQKIIMARSSRPLLHATVLVVVCSLAAVTVVLALSLSRSRWLIQTQDGRTTRCVPRGMPPNVRE
jgi:hypothetical protein